MPSTDISYTTRDNETFTGYLAEPDGDGKMPGILLITAIFGIDDEMKELADAWAADGFIVSVPDIFWRVMPGPTADIEKAFDRYNAFDAEQGYKDVEDLMENLRSHPRCNGKAGVLGFCFGGRYAQYAVARLGADAGAFHGTLIDQGLDRCRRPIVRSATISGRTIRWCPWLWWIRSNRPMRTTPMPRSSPMMGRATISPCPIRTAIMPAWPPRRARRFSTHSTE